MCCVLHCDSLTMYLKSYTNMFLKLNKSVLNTSWSYVHFLHIVVIHGYNRVVGLNLSVYLSVCPPKLYRLKKVIKNVHIYVSTKLTCHLLAAMLFSRCSCYAKEMKNKWHYRCSVNKYLTYFCSINDNCSQRNHSWIEHCVLPC